MTLTHYWSGGLRVEGERQVVLWVFNGDYGFSMAIHGFQW